MLYNDGIQAVVTLSIRFGQEELGLGMSSLTSAILLVQFLGVFGALLFGYLTGRLGARRAIMLSKARSHEGSRRGFSGVLTFGAASLRLGMPPCSDTCDG